MTATSFLMASTSAASTQRKRDAARFSAPR
jgi:hypothetical protein